MNNNEPCKILISSLDAHGHVNASLGIGAVLAKRGNEVYFLNKTSYKEAAEKQGIKFLAIEDYSEKSDQKEESNSLAHFYDGMYEKFKTPAKERPWCWGDIDKRMMGSLYQGNLETGKIIEKLIPKLGIDLVMGDFVMITPFFMHCPVPYVPIVSYNPLVLYDGPAFGSGHSVYDGPEKWREFTETAGKRKDEDLMNINAPSFKEAGLDVPDPLEAWNYVKELGVYVYPEVLDYKELKGPKPKWVRMESAVRKPTATEFEIPENLKDKPGKLIFFSLGTLGTACRKLMAELLQILGKIPHRFIVAKGVFGDEFELPDNMWGQNYVDQLAILPKVDMVMTHGGNNSLVEVLVAGKPMIVMPLYGDQLDNAQRIVDLGLGRKIDRLVGGEEEIRNTIEELLADESVKEKVAEIADRLKNSDSSEKVAGYIEQLARTRVSPF